MIKKSGKRNIRTKIENNLSQGGFPSELRQDVVSENWVVIATGRAKRPEAFKKKLETSQRTAKKDCPFCQNFFQEKPLLAFRQGKEISLPSKAIPADWTTIVVPNKYPAFLPRPELKKRMEGKFYQVVEAVGFHEVVITRDHDKHLALLSATRVKEVIDVYQRRYLDLMKERFVNYIAIFHNHGRQAGASIYHPHSQIITTPLIDTDLKRALSNAQVFWKKNKSCLYCKMNKWDRKIKQRIVFENQDFIALCPFASKMAFQVIVSPKKHLPYFEKITEREKINLAQVLKETLVKLYKGLGNPAYNFYLHTSPCDNKEYPFYHWHWTILPKTSIYAGFELGAGIEISTLEPERAAQYLREQ